MRRGRGRVVGGVGGIFGAERVTLLPALRGQYAMTETGGVVRPVVVVGIVGDLGSTAEALC